MAMTRNDLLNATIDDGIYEIQINYTKPHQLAKRNGGIAGFEACRGKSDEELLEILQQADERVKDFKYPFSFVLGDHAYDCYWYDRNYQAQVKWVINVMSAAMHGQGRKPLSDFTLRGFLKAADILNPQPA